MVLRSMLFCYRWRRGDGLPPHERRAVALGGDGRAQDGKNVLACGAYHVSSVFAGGLCQFSSLVFFWPGCRCRAAVSLPSYHATHWTRPTPPAYCLRGSQFSWQATAPAPAFPAAAKRHPSPHFFCRTLLPVCALRRWTLPLYPVPVSRVAAGLHGSRALRTIFTASPSEKTRCRNSAPATAARICGSSYDGWRRRRLVVLGRQQAARFWVLLPGHTYYLALCLPCLCLPKHAFTATHHTPALPVPHCFGWVGGSVTFFCLPCLLALYIPSFILLVPVWGVY